jgi:hypothetical protein
MYNQYIKEHIYHEVSNITTMEFASKENAGDCPEPFDKFDAYWANRDLCNVADRVAQNTSPAAYFKSLQKQPMTAAHHSRNNPGSVQRNDSVADQAGSAHKDSHTSNQAKWLAARNARNTAGHASNQDKWLAARNARNATNK